MRKVLYISLRQLPPRLVRVLLVSTGLSTNQLRSAKFFCRVSKIGHVNSSTESKGALYPPHVLHFSGSHLQDRQETHERQRLMNSDIDGLSKVSRVTKPVQNQTHNAQINLIRWVKQFHKPSPSHHHNK